MPTFATDLALCSERVRKLRATGGWARTWQLCWKKGFFTRIVQDTTRENDSKRRFLASYGRYYTSQPSEDFGLLMNLMQPPSLRVYDSYEASIDAVTPSMLSDAILDYPSSTLCSNR